MPNLCFLTHTDIIHIDFLESFSFSSANRIKEKSSSSSDSFMLTYNYNQYASIRPREEYSMYSSM